MKYYVILKYFFYYFPFEYNINTDFFCVSDKWSICRILNCKPRKQNTTYLSSSRRKLLKNFQYSLASWSKVYWCRFSRESLIYLLVDARARGGAKGRMSPQAPPILTTKPSDVTSYVTKISLMAKRKGSQRSRQAQPLVQSLLLSEMNTLHVYVKLLL